MATLAGATIASTYTMLLKMADTGIDSTLNKIESGDADDGALSLSTTAIGIDTTDKMHFDGIDGAFGASNTYIHEAAADRLDFVVGGDVDGLVLLEAGGLTSVGLGIAAPLAQLHIVGSDTSDQVIIENSDGGTASAPDLILYRNSASPVAADSLGNITFRGNDVSGLDSSANYASIGCLIDQTTNGDEQGTLQFFTAGPAGGSNSVKMTILNDGNVGVGTTTPISALEVEDGVTTGGAILTLGTKETTVVADDVLGRINFYAPLEGSGTDAIAVAASISAVAQDTFTSSVNKTALYFQTGSSEDATGTTASMVVDEDGNVGIGTTSPDTLLEIEGTGDPSLVCQIKATAMTDTDYAAFVVQGTGNSVANISRFGIMYENGAATDAPTSFMRLDPSDGTANFLWLDDSNNLRISTTSTHVGTTSGTVVGTQSSDERLKDISSDAFPYGLIQINAVTPIKYQLKDDASNRDRLGFGAQTIQSIIPESVHNTSRCIDGYDIDNETDRCTAKTSDTDYELGMEYVQIIPVLVKAVQELSASNDALKARIEVLEAA